MKQTEKHVQIMTAAAALFAKYGYKKTSIDEIVSAAGISKGLFYHYYTNKAELYVSLYDTYADILSRRVREDVNREEQDFFERLKQISHIRIDFIQQYPDLWGFLYSAYYEEHPDVAPWIKEKNERLLESSCDNSAANIDWSKLKAGISPEKAIELVTWLAEGFVRKVNQGGIRWEKEPYLEFDNYIEILRTGLYEKGGEENAVL